MAPIKFKALDVAKVFASAAFKDPVKAGGGGVKAMYHADEVYVQFPAMVAPFDFGRYHSDGKESFSLSVTDAATLAKVNAIDEAVAAMLVTRLGRTAASVEANYYPMIKTPKDPQYPPTLKFEIQRGAGTGSAGSDSGKPGFDVVDAANQPAALEDVMPKRATVTVVAKLVGVMLFSGTKASLKWSVATLRGVPPADWSKCAILSDDDEPSAHAPVMAYKATLPLDADKMEQQDFYEEARHTEGGYDESDA